MARRALAAAAAIAAVAALWALLRVPLAQRRSDAPHATTAPLDVAAADSPRRDAIAAALRRAPAAAPPQAPPASLRDTDIDGSLAVDADGKLLVTPALRRFFEYFFVASGEESDDRIRERIETEIDARLSGAAQGAAADLLDRYLSYRERGRSLADGELPGGDLMARVDALRRLRRESFGEHDAAALFADEEAALAVAAEQHRIAADPTLSEDERVSRLAALEAELPEPIRSARAAVTGPLRLAREEAALRAAGGAPEEIQALREDAVGSEAAQRLAGLDQQRAEWQARVDAYRQERATIDADASLDATQRDAALDALRGRHFTGPELLRIRALDHLEASAAP
jgi:lipase chaperone LimK